MKLRFHRKPTALNFSRVTLVSGLLISVVISGIGLAARQFALKHVGKQQDGTYIVSTLQQIDPGAISFPGRPIDMALSPDGRLLAVLNHRRVLLVSQTGTVGIDLPQGAGFRGVAWHPAGKRLFVSTAAGYIQELDENGSRWDKGRLILPKPAGAKGNPRPGGLAITADGARLFAAVMDRNSVAEIDLNAKSWIREYKVQNLPFEVQLTSDEKSLVVSNWGGRDVKADDDEGTTGGAVIAVDPRGSALSGTISIIKRATGETKKVDVGLHPTAIAIIGDNAYVANAASDTIDEISISNKKTLRTFGIRWAGLKLFGSMPCALVARNNTLFVCNGGDNAICEIDLATGKVLGFRPAGYFPVSICLNKSGTRAFVLNTKGDGSVLRTNRGQPGNAHDFLGTVSVIDLRKDLSADTARVASYNGWNRDRTTLKPNLPVYHGAIKHVLYVIKENRTYDEILGDMREGNGDPRLCDLGETITPNNHALARQFALLDNTYVTGTNSADGHQWCTQALANDYIEHFYTGYRTYPDNGDCAMAISSSGCLWDAALRKKLSFRDYGEFCDGKLAMFTPSAKNWTDLWKDRQSGKHLIRSSVSTRLKSLRPYINPNLCYWPLWMSDQQRADIFIDEYRKFSKGGRVPSLMLLTLPCDHTMGRNPDYPRPQSMVADNDLALGRVVEAITNSPEWKSTCVFVIEDDAQFGPDHVDGHRTVCFALSPYTKKKYVDHELCNTLSLIHSIELMLGIDPMNRFDSLTPPFSSCFTNIPDYSSYKAVLNRIPLDQMNPSTQKLTGIEKTWTKQSMALDWSGPDKADPVTLNKILWKSLHPANYPSPIY